VNPRTLLAALAAVAVFGLVLFLTRTKPGTPEQEVRALISRAQAAVEKKDLPAFSDTLAERFQGSGPASKAEVKQVLLGVFFQHREPIAVMNPSLEVTVESPTAATFKGTFVTAGGRAGEGSMDKLEVTGRAEKTSDGWQIVSASWNR
jgi:ketosteroid isomerase-like protein